jgi:nicotinate-nucleotide adenylyltransferase
MGRRVKIGVLGGTFDPPHVGHLIVAEQARAQLGLDQVWFTPVGQPPHKNDRDVSRAEDRVAMTRLAIADNPNFVLCMDDVTRPGPHYTLTLMYQLQHTHTEHTWHLIIGGDSLVDMPKWHQPTQLVALVRLAVAHRPGSQPNITQMEGAIPNLRTRIDWIHSPLVHVSSSDLRQRFAAGLPLRYAVPDTVIDYITTQRRYQSSHPLKNQY